MDHYIWRGLFDDKIRGIARFDGPAGVAQLLHHDGVWVDRPRLITRRREPDYDLVSKQDAVDAATSLGIAWPAETYYVDEDTTDAYMDLPESRYVGGQTAAERAAKATAPGSKVKPLPLPPLTDH